MRLVSFESSHAARVAAWAVTPQDLAHWAALANPATEVTFVAWHADPDVHPWLLVDKEPVAYGELWVSEEEDEVELARLLVDPARRSQGIGKELVASLIDAARVFRVSTTWVRVVPENAAALRCYESKGFTYAPREMETRFNAQQPRRYRWLRLAL